MTVVLCFGAASMAHAKKRDVIRIPGGATVPKLGIAFDASYDSRLDNFIPGNKYKVLQVGLFNNSFNIIAMDPKRDKWVVETAEGRKSYTAIVDLRLEDPKTWNELSDSARKSLVYPLLLPIGARQVFDLFVPYDAPLESMRQVNITIDSINMEIQIIAAE